MTTLKDFNQYGEELERMMILKTSPLAVKMLENEADIPEGAFRPKKDTGKHIAQCQAFALSRRDRKTVAMLKEDNWCFAPLIAYGLVDKPDDPALQPFVTFPRFDRDRYIGIVSAPLKTATFEPDVVVIYSNTAQMRDMLWPLSFAAQDAVDYFFFPPACGYQVVPVMNEGNYMVTLPDPGDYMRALAGEDEIILSVPKDRMDEFMTALKRFRDRGPSDVMPVMFMQADFPRPEFYQNLFREWGLDTED